MDAESAHNLGMALIGMGLVRCPAPATHRRDCSLFGTPLPHPIGLAAGFDKNAVAVDEWEHLGFSFVEIGTVTPRPQPGNPKPRLFRLTEDQAIINRMGFNNDGVLEIAKRLERRETTMTIGANIGKNKSTEQADAVSDYKICAQILAPLVNYLVINVSSPNTPGLRDLQQTDTMKSIIEAVKAVAGETPVLVKLSPDMRDDDTAQLSAACIQAGCDGLVLTNTTLARTGLDSPNQDEAGGLSGKPLTQRANDLCRLVRAAVGELPTIIGVGGIFSGQDFAVRLNAGANLCQIYTGFIYRGPCAVRKILQEAECLE